MLEREKEVVRVFNTLEEYFTIMRDWHRTHGGIAVEEQVLELIQQNLKGNVLDAGCGEGSLGIWLTKNVPHINVWGVDVSKIGIDMAKSVSSDVNNVKFTVANLKNLPFEDNFFDLIILQSVLEHVVNYENALKEFKRVLKRKGKLIIRVGNGSVAGKKLIPSFFKYLFHRNKVVELNPSLKLGENKLCDHMHNFDVNNIPSDILLKQLKELKFKIKYFTTNRKEGLNISEYKKYNIIKQFFIYAYIKIPFYPFTHMGPTIILMGEKQ